MGEDVNARHLAVLIDAGHDRDVAAVALGYVDYHAAEDVAVLIESGHDGGAVLKGLDLAEVGRVGKNYLP